MKKCFNKMKENRGITLVALIITIIILLILAGISIAQLTGNGLFEKAKTAKEVSKNVQEDEEDKIAKYSNEINSYVSGTWREVSEERIREIVQEINQKSIITTKVSSAYNTTSTSENIKFNQVYSSTGNAFELTNDGIKINKNISHVKISAHIYISSGLTNGEVPFASLRLNNTSLFSTSTRACNSSGEVSLHIEPILVDVQQNDIINILINNFNSTGRKVTSNTYITIEEIG